MARALAIAIASLSLASCTSTIKPIGLNQSYSAFDSKSENSIVRGCEAPEYLRLNDLTSPDRGGNTARLEWLSCEMLAKSMSNFVQATSLKNRTEWRDIPIIGSAITAAALFLFGERGTDGNLKAGEIDVLEGLALGTAGFIVLADYLNPHEASNLLFRSAEGHRCLAEHGQTVAAYSNIIFIKTDELNGAFQARRELRATISDLGPGELKQRATEAITEADKVISFYLKQRTALEQAPAKLYSASYELSVELAKRARRQPVSLNDIQSDLTENARLLIENSEITPPATDGNDPAVGIMNDDEEERVVQLASQLESLTSSLAEGLPNIGLLVNGFDLCTSLTLAGSDLPSPKIVFSGD